MAALRLRAGMVPLLVRRQAMRVQGVRAFAAAASSSKPTHQSAPPPSPSPSSAGVPEVSSDTTDPNTLIAGGLGISALVRPGGRQSVSGIVATVFGCSGTLGRFVVNHLGGIGSQVICPYRSIDGMNVRHLKLAGDLGQIVPIPFDMSDMESLRRCIARSNVVINLIGYRAQTHHYTFDDVHVKIPYRLAQVSKAMGVERFIHVSALGAAEKSPSAFFQSKYDGEQAVKEFYPDATIIRPSLMFGPQDHFLSYYGFLGAKFAAIPMTNGGKRVVQPVFVGDVARGILNSLADPNARGTTYELAGPDKYTENETLELVGRHTVRSIKPFYMSDRMGSLYGQLIGGRRKFAHWETGNKIYDTIFALTGKLSMPTVFNPDMVAQKRVDVVLSGQYPGLEALGVEEPRKMIQEIERVLLPHRAEAIDRFPEADIMKRDARDTASL